MKYAARNQVIGSVVTEEVNDETLAAAKAGDRDAGASILMALEGRFKALARRAATTAFSDDKAHLREAFEEDFLQEAHLAAWERLTATEEETLDGFFAYAYETARQTLQERAAEVKNGSNEDREGKKLFAQMVKRFREADVAHNLTEADYLTLAEQAVQDKGMVATLNGGAYASRVRMSADAAAAARLAYQGSVSIYQDVSSSTASSPGDLITLADTLTSRVTVEDQADMRPSTGYRPVQWVVPVRALEEGLTLPKDSETRDRVLTALDRFRTGTVTEEDLDLMESLPCRSAEVGRAVAQLRALFIERQHPEPRTAEENAAALLSRGSIALNAQRAAHERALDRVVTKLLVRKVVGMLGPAQAYVLAATFGFQGMGTFKDDKAIARAMNRAGFEGMDAMKVAVYRRKARLAFAKKWADLVAKNGSESAALAEAAEKADRNATKAEAKGVTFISDLIAD